MFNVRYLLYILSPMKIITPFFAIISLVFLALTKMLPAQVSNTALVAYLAFDGDFSDTTRSISLVSNQGATFAADRFGRAASAVFFDGSGFVSYGDVSILDGATEATWSFWIKTTQALPSSGEISVVRKNGAWIPLQWGNDPISRTWRSPLFVQGNASWSGPAYGPISGVSDGRWHHFVVIFRSSSVVAFVDGSLIPNLSSYGTFSGGGLVNSSHPFVLGGANEVGNGPERFLGSLDDLRIYRRALSVSEAQELYRFESSPPASPPSILEQPAGQSLLAGQSIQLSVTASGSSPLSYQWLKSGAVIAGATAATYSVTGVTTSDSGSYSVVVSNAYGAVYSSSATVTVAQPAAPVITTQPRSVSATSGSTVSFTVEASGTPSPSYQWLKDGAPVAGATTRTLIFLSVSSANAGTYAVAASNSQGTVVSSGATLTVTAPVSAPAFTSQPASQTASAGSSVVLTAGAVGSPQPAYQWLKNGAVIVGATNAALILPSVSSSDAGNYYVIATNTAGAATSTSATLAVTPASALSNLSVRTTLSSGQTLIVGGVVSGGSKPILVRAAGPALNKFGLVGMFDPRLELYAGQVPVGSNDNWQSTLATTFSRVGAFAFDVGSLDAAFSQSLNGAFTVQAKGTGPGALLVEAYDTGGGVAPRMVNISARNFVGTGADILIAGFALSGTGTKQLLIRAVGPTLAAFGVSNALADPKVAVLSGAGVIITENDNWEAALAATFSQVGAFPLSIGSRDAALLVTLSAGASFTVQVSGVNGTTGEALIEIYEVF